MLREREEVANSRASGSLGILDKPHLPAGRLQNAAPDAPPTNANADLICKIASLQAEINVLQADIAVRHANLANIRRQPGFRLLEEFRGIGRRLMPHGTRRERVGNAIVDCILSGMLAVSGFGHAVLQRLQPKREPPKAGGNPPLPPPSLLPGGATIPATSDSQKTADAPVNATSANPVANGAASGSGQSSSPDPLRPPFAPLTWQTTEKNSTNAQPLHLMIFSAGQRAGSTLLQRICNARKGTLIWGEHGGLLKHFHSIFTNASYFAMAGGRERDAFFEQSENPNLWIASMSPDLERVEQAMIDSVRAFFGSLYSQHRESHDILGFKEVRYYGGEAELLLKCYPEAHFLMLIRNPLNCWKSMPREWGWTVDHWGREWNAFASSFRTLAAEHARCHLIRYEDILQQDARTMAVLAEVAQVSEWQISEVLANKLGSTGHKHTVADAERDVILQHCREPMEALGYF